MENEIDEIIKNIPDLQKKRANTIYEINLVNQIYIKKINVFFEYYKINYSTVSRQVGVLDYKYLDNFTEIARYIRKNYGLTVRVHGI